MTADDVRYGRRGGRTLPKQSPVEQEADWRAAITEGRIIQASCDCTMWWLIPRQLGELCHACQTTMRTITDMRKVAAS